MSQNALGDQKEPLQGWLNEYIILIYKSDIHTNAQ